jgi:hypothetical protein
MTAASPRLPRVLYRLWALILLVTAVACLILSGLGIARGLILFSVPAVLASVLSIFAVFLLRMNYHQMQANKALAEENAGLRRALDADAPGGAS